MQILGNCLAYTYFAGPVFARAISTNYTEFLSR